MNRIITEHVCPPIPVRSSDWAAYREGWEPGDFTGRGASEKDAIADLIDIEEANEFIRDEQRLQALEQRAEQKDERHENQ